MSLLAPLYLAGLAALALPVVFHLIRRTPTGRTAFSSLMFLRPSPPRFARRRRLDQIALLALRALVLALIALAFARPFLRSDARVDAGPDARRLAVLVDTSASMRRPGLWDAALRAARAALEGAPPGARVSLHAFDRELRTLADLGELERLAPTWAATDLGGALVELAESLDAESAEPGAPATVVLVSDFQAGADLAALESFDWPRGVRLEVRRVATAAENASLHPVPPEPGRSAQGAVWVRVSNEGTSTGERFGLAWASGAGPAGAELAVLCPPGETRVVRAPERPADPAVDRLVLSGDDCPFDDTLFDRAPGATPLRVLSIGPADDRDEGPESPGFFLEHVFAEMSGAPVELARAGAAPDLAPDVAGTPLVVLELGGATPDPPIGALRAYVEAGGTVLAVARAGAAPGALRALFDEPRLDLREAARAASGFALLAEIDFEHPLFAPFADPRYSDFTKIRFWRHRLLELPEPPGSPGPPGPLGPAGTRVLARLDDGAPLLVERPRGRGRVLVLAAGWEPADSDLARSSKFAPLLIGMLALSRQLDLATRRILVGERIALAAGGGEVLLDTATPGHHEVEALGRVHAYTVHLDPRESRTDPLDETALARLDVALVDPARNALRTERTRQEQRLELEERQKLWRWLILAAVVGLLLETLWAGRLARGAEATG